MKPVKPVLNRTPEGQLACCFQTPWLDHFLPPIGTGKGCPACAAYQGQPTKVQKR